MKRVLLLGFILAICILAIPQGVLAALPTADVNAKVVEYVEFTATGDPTLWNLYYAEVPALFPVSAGAPNNKLVGPLDVTLDSNSNNWQIGVMGDNTGHLKPYVSGEYTGDQLQNALHIVDSDTGDLTPTPSDLTVSGGYKLLASGVQDDDWTNTYDYTQLLDYRDDPRSDYKIVLTFDYNTAGSWT